MDKLGMVGAVLISPSGTPVRYFSEQVPEYWMEFFMSESKHPIFELELLPVWCSLCVWETFVQHSQTVFYLDNEAAKSALINGATTTSSGQKIIQEFVTREMRCQLKVWFTRVPTASNVSDRPSRLDTSEMDALGVVRSVISWSDLWSKLNRLGSEEWGFKTGIPEISPNALR